MNKKKDRRDFDNIISKATALRLCVHIYEYTAYLEFVIVGLAKLFHSYFRILMILFIWLNSCRLVNINR